jgi:hypothetical protein
VLSGLCAAGFGFIFLNRDLQWKIIGTGHALPMVSKAIVIVGDTAGL